MGQSHVWWGCKYTTVMNNCTFLNWMFGWNSQQSTLRACKKPFYLRLSLSSKTCLDDSIY